jgi:hypothetical protein
MISSKIRELARLSQDKASRVSVASKLNARANIYSRNKLRPDTINFLVSGAFHPTVLKILLNEGLTHPQIKAKIILHFTPKAAFENKRLAPGVVFNEYTVKQVVSAMKMLPTSIFSTDMNKEVVKELQKAAPELMRYKLLCETCSYGNTPPHIIARLLPLIAEEDHTEEGINAIKNIVPKHWSRFMDTMTALSYTDTELMTTLIKNMDLPENKLACIIDELVRKACRSIEIVTGLLPSDEVKQKNVLRELKTINGILAYELAHNLKERGTIT